MSDNVIYDKVFVNKGNAYDKNSGIFICPIPGKLSQIVFADKLRSSPNECIRYVKIVTALA